MWAQSGEVLCDTIDAEIRKRLVQKRWFDISPPIRYPVLENMTTTNQLNGEAPLLV